MEQLFDKLPVRKLSRGQILIYEGDPVDNIYLLVKGYVKVSYLQQGENRRTIFVYAPGESFPLTSYLSGVGVTRYFYECMTDSEVKAMPQNQFQELIKGDLELGEKLISYTYTLNELFSERIETLTARSARHKIASVLAFLADRAGTPADDKICLNIPLTSQTLADMCNLTRETASLQIQRLKKDGVIKGGRTLTVDSQKLQKIIAS
ncbi:MAG TPA: Crp/Fnr family transcriptional regulator [Candidatus Saccharimonadales bacterium]|nr:Crp/Fnr family transcriptional regulator [Candidatus Saccharimonadales bacterium]